MTNKIIFAFNVIPCFCSFEEKLDRYVLWSNGKVERVVINRNEKILERITVEHNGDLSEKVLAFLDKRHDLIDSLPEDVSNYRVLDGSSYYFRFDSKIIRGSNTLCETSIDDENFTNINTMRFLYNEMTKIISVLPKIEFEG